LDPNTCSYCGNEVPLDWVYCPHCGDGLKCPNVILAGQSIERDALERRYQAASASAGHRGCDAVVREFETATRASQAVMGSTLQKLMPIVRRDRDIFATYHDLAELRFLRDSAPHGPDWNVVRPAAEIALLGSHKHISKLHYAALALDGRSLPHYGEVTVLLRENLIARRVSLFQENSAVYVHRHGIHFPEGTRGIWEERHKLCVAKLAEQLTKATRRDEFSTILLQKGPNAIDDQFVEVHLFGPMTFATFEKVTVRQMGARPSSPKRPRKRRGTTDEQALVDYCKIYKTECELM